MLAYNVDLLFLPAESVGLQTTQTRFYCQFVRKARLMVRLAKQVVRGDSSA